jgi:hypothetical protein
MESTKEEDMDRGWEAGWDKHHRNIARAPGIYLQEKPQSVIPNRKETWAVEELLTVSGCRQIYNKMNGEHVWMRFRRLLACCEIWLI